MAGITSSGFDRETFTNIQDSIKQAFIDSLGATVNTNPETVIGHMVDLYSVALDDVWHLFEELHANKDIRNLEGVSLDNMAESTRLMLRFSGESDADFINRITNLAQGGNLYGNIMNALYNVPNVTLATILYNDGNVTNAAGIPSHSWAVVVDGGSDADIASELIRYHAGGTGLFGNTSVNATDDQGYCRAVKFTRAEPLNITIRVKLAPNSSPCSNCKPLDTKGIYNTLKDNNCNNDNYDYIRFPFGKSLSGYDIASLAPPSSGLTVSEIEIIHNDIVYSGSDVFTIKWYQYIVLKVENVIKI